MPILPRGAPPRDPLFPLRAVAALGGARFEALLGVDARGAPVFAASLADGAVEELADLSDGFLDRRTLVVPGRDDLELVDLRTIAVQGLVSAQALAILGQAKAILHWHARHGHCANCGAPTRIAAAGWRRECDACKAQHFPRTDPVVIMLAVDGEQCLLGRQARFPKGMYSCLAGFRRTRRDDRRGGAARNPRGGRRRVRRSRLCRLAALAVPVLADDGLSRRERPRAR